MIEQRNGQKKIRQWMEDEKITKKTATVKQKTKESSASEKPEEKRKVNKVRATNSNNEHTHRNDKAAVRKNREQRRTYKNT